MAPYSSLAPKIDQNGATLSPNGYYVNPANPGWPPPNTTLAAGTAGTSSAVYTAPLTSATEGQANLINPYSIAGSNQAYIPSYDQGQNAYSLASVQLKTSTGVLDQASADVVKHTEAVNYYQNQVTAAQNKLEEVSRPVLNEQGEVIGTYGSTTAIYQAESNLNIAKSSLEDANSRLQASTELVNTSRTQIATATNTIDSVSPTYSINNGQTTFPTTQTFTDTGLNGVSSTPAGASTVFGFNGPVAQTGLGSFNNPQPVSPNPIVSTVGGGNEFPVNLTSSNVPLPVARPDGSVVDQTAVAGDVRYTAYPAFNPNAIQDSINVQLAAQAGDVRYSISTSTQTQISAVSFPQPTATLNIPTGTAFQISGNQYSGYVASAPLPPQPASSVREANFPLPQNQSTIEANFPLPQNQSTIEANYPGNTPIDGTPVGFNSLTSGNGPTQIPLGDAAQNPLNTTRDNLSQSVSVEGQSVGYNNATNPALTGDLGYSSPPPVAAGVATVESPDTGAYASNTVAPQVPAFAGGNFSTSGYTVPGDVGGNGGFTITNSRTDFAPVTNAGGTAVAKPGQGGTAGSDTPGSSQQSGQQAGSC